MKKENRPSCFDKFKSLRWLIYSLLAIFVGAVVLVSQARQIGSIQSQSKEMVPLSQDSYTYLLSEAMPIVTTATFDVTQLLQVLANSQKLDKSVPVISQTTFEKFTHTDKNNLEKFICENTKVSYSETIKTIKSQYYGSCQIIDWADTKIRFLYRLADLEKGSVVKAGKTSK